MPRELTATCETGLALAAAGRAPEWVDLLPSGEIAGRDGRSFTVDDPAALVAAFNAAKVDLPVDYEHQNDKPAPGRTGPVPAAGWIKALKVAANGLWGRIEWTARAAALIGAKEYRYISPVIVHRPDGSVVGLKGAGLVHHPNIHLTALAAQDDTMPDTTDSLTRIAAALGLDPDADEIAILAAIEVLPVDGDGATPDPAKFVPIEALKDLMTDRNTKAAAMHQDAVKSKVDDAMRRGHLTPAMKPWALALCSQDPDAFNSFVKSSAAPYQHLHTESYMARAYPPDGPAASGSPEAENIARQLGLPPGSLKD